jgi:hypothetical protein
MELLLIFNLYFMIILYIVIYIFIRIMIRFYHILFGLVHVFQFIEDFVMH